MRTFDVSAAKIIDLETRLAQAERTAASNLGNYKELLKSAERERDDWKATASELTERAGKLRAERDVALAKVEKMVKAHSFQLEQCHIHRQETLAKVEAAQADAATWRETANDVAGSASELTDLRVRIEALADDWELAIDHKGHSVLQPMGCGARALRALLQPLKEESALDVLARMQAGWGSGDDEYGDAEFTDDMAKLRKFLEVQ